jgi:hypothetical protein
MSGPRKTSKRSPERMGGEIKTELRNILHNLCELQRPINRFYTSPDRPIGVPRHFVSFDTTPHRSVSTRRTAGQTARWQAPRRILRDDALD